MQRVATQTMKAVRIHGFGGPEVLEYEDTPRPEPEKDEVLIKVHASGVNPIDWKIMEGMFKTRTLPLTPGWDFSGVVEAAGPDAAFKKGDEVFGRPDTGRDGSYAEYLVARSSEIARKPVSIDHVHAAGLALAGLTAWQALFDIARLQAGQRILVHGAAGGVGGFAVQLAQWKGAHVTGTASRKNSDFVRTLGVDEFVDYNSDPFESVVSGMDVVLDTIGGETQTRSLKTLKPGGILVSTVGLPSPGNAETPGIRRAMVMVKPDSSQLSGLAGLVDTGALVVPVENVFPLSEARKALELSRTLHARGKIILRVI
jgi:NADPH:quinone reductase-like Zn-dependent oxidoreductase